MTDPKLSDQMPERIMVQFPANGAAYGIWSEAAVGWSVEYVRADKYDELQVERDRLVTAIDKGGK